MVPNLYQSNDFIVVLKVFNIMLQLRIAFVGGDVSFVYDCHVLSNYLAWKVVVAFTILEDYPTYKVGFKSRILQNYPTHKIAIKSRISQN